MKIFQLLVFFNWSIFTVQAVQRSYSYFKEVISVAIYIYIYTIGTIYLISYTNYYKVKLYGKIEMKLIEDIKAFQVT